MAEPLHWQAIADLGLERAYVVAPVREGYPLAENVEVLPAPSGAHCAGLTSHDGRTLGEDSPNLRRAARSGESVFGPSATDRAATTRRPAAAAGAVQSMLGPSR